MNAVIITSAHSRIFEASIREADGSTSFTYFKKEENLREVFPDAVWLCDAKRDSRVVIRGVFRTAPEIEELGNRVYESVYGDA